MSAPEIAIELIHDAAGVRQAMAVLCQVWGPTGAQDVDVYVAIAHRGGYVSIARDADGTAVGAGMGFLADGGRSLHSHVVGVTAPSSGIGREIKLHQRAWCAERGIEAITWTFDPLVRRNAWFNLGVLGARVTAYHVNLYGIFDDEINGREETDRFEVRWAVDPTAARPGPVEVGPDQRLIDVPADIESLRRSDPTAATRWRQTLRAALADELHAGATITGMTADRRYVLQPAPATRRNR